MNKFMTSASLLTQKGDEFISQHGPVEFHKKAHELLDQAALHNDFDFTELVECSFLEDFNKKQNYASAQFSDFPLTISSGEHCFLDIYFWRRRPTVIHNHHFTGAFQCLEGVNVDLEFEYKKNRKLGLYHDLGEVVLKDSRKILKGDIAPIDLLDKFIHQNHHQAELTINVCFRTPDIGETNLSNYLYSGLRFEKHPELLNRTNRLWNFLFMGEFNPEKLQLNIDDALCFLLQHQHSTSLSKNFVKLKNLLDRRVKEELGVDVAGLLAKHEVRMDELENLYD
jgi:hypothetical protein